MKLQSMSCPKCGGQLYFEDEQDTCYCTHCGTQIFKNDSNKKTYTYRTIDDARIKENEAKKTVRLKELEYRENARKRDIKFAIGLWIFIILGFATTFIAIAIQDAKDEKNAAQFAEQGMISAGESSDYVGKNYIFVETVLEDRGFNNIVTIPLGDANEEKIKDTVESVSVAGEVSFKNRDYYDPEVKVSIFYH